MRQDDKPLADRPRSGPKRDTALAEHWPCPPPLRPLPFPLAAGDGPAAAAVRAAAGRLRLPAQDVAVVAARLPPRVRRLAKASRDILAMQFHPTGNRWAVRGHALRALIRHPTFWRYQQPEHLRRLVPGYGRARMLYRRLATRRVSA